MSRSVAAIQQGLDYQARFFWRYAALRLLNPSAPISRVGFDVDDVDGFDDVVVERSSPERDEFGRSVSRDCYQVKFHVDHAGALTATSLTDPRDFGGTARSLLERVKSAHAKLGAEAECTRLHLVTTYPIDREDLLAKLVSSNEGGLRIRELLNGSPRSKMGKLRSEWREHLKLGSDDELVGLLRSLRFWANAPSYAKLRDELEAQLPSVGLRPTNGDGAQSPYEQLIWNLHKEETYYFTHQQLRGECERAGLTAALPGLQPRRPKVGVRSFKRPGFELADSADELLSLLEFFDGRFLFPEHSWSTVREQLKPFFTSVITKFNAFDLQIDTHASLAFVSGSLLQPKLGLDLNVLQFSRSGLESWPTATTSATPRPDLAVEDVSVGEGSDLAVALAITHDIVEEVRHHIADAELPIGRLLAVRPTEGSGQAAVRDGRHALAIADEVARLVKRRTPEERKGRLHLFAAAPNGLIFFVGQLSGSFGTVTLYEYDFEQTRSGGYEPSFSLSSSPIS